MENNENQTNKNIKDKLFKAANEARKMAMKIFMNLIGRKILIVALIVVLIIVGITLFYYGVTHTTFTKLSETFSDVGSFFKIEGNEIVVDQNKLDEAYKEIEKMGINIKSLGFGDSEKDYLKEFLEAEVITTYPHLGDTGLQGIIYFERNNIDGTITQLEYKEYNEFMQSYDNGDSNIRNYFTLEETSDNTSSAETDSSVKRVVKYVKLTSDGGMELDSIDYRTYSDGQSLPFEFSIALCLITQNPNFLSAVTSLAKNSKIVITIAEEEVITKENNKLNYDIVDKYQKKGSNTTRSHVVKQGVEEDEGTTTVTSYSSRVVLTTIDTWRETKTTNLSYDSSENVYTSTEALETETISENTVMDGSDVWNIIRMAINRTRTTTTTVTTKKWNQGATQITAELDKFLSLIIKPVGKNIIGGTGSYTGVTYPGTKYNLTDDQKEVIARMILCEDGTEEGIRAVASQMGNLYEYYSWEAQKGDSYAQKLVGGRTFYEFITLKSQASGGIGWYASADVYRQKEGDWYDTNQIPLAISVVEDCIINGNRTLPLYINEFDGFSEFSKSTQQKIKNEYVSGVTKMNGTQGGNGIFYALINDNVFFYSDEYKTYIETLSPTQSTPSSGDGNNSSTNQHIVVVDAGHGVAEHGGGYDNLAKTKEDVQSGGKAWYTTGTEGKTSSGKTLEEWVLNQKVVEYVQEILKAYPNIKVIQTGKDQPNIYRMQLAKDAGAELYVGVHLNSNDDKSVSGTYIYCSNESGNEVSQKIGDIFLNTVSNSLGVKAQSVESNEYTGLGSATTWGFPNIYTEGLFMSNQSDMDIIGADNDEGLKKYAEGIANGILKSFELAPDADWTKLSTVSQTNSSYNQVGYSYIGGERVYYDLPTGGRSCPIDALENGRGILFELLKKSEKTQEHEQLMRYALYKLTGKSYGVESISSNDGFTSSTLSDISLTTSKLTKEQFISALQDYAKKSGNISFQANFLNRAGEIYDLGLKYNVNPELIITMAEKESNFKTSNNNQNFWGLNTPNGESLAYISSFEEGVSQLAESFKKYMSGSGTWQEEKINEIYKQRQAANCNSNGYGLPGTLKGMLSIYSDLCGSVNEGKHFYGNWSDGGTIYLEKIYGAEYETKCGFHENGTVGAGGHTSDTEFTIQEKADYTAYLYENQLKYWKDIFGQYANLGGDIISACQDVMNKWISRGVRYSTNILAPNVEQAYESYGYGCCATYTSTVLYRAGLLSAEHINKYQFHSTNDMPEMLKDAGWKEVGSLANLQLSDLQVGDVLNRRRSDSNGAGHVVIYVGDGLVYDQSSGVYSSSGSAPSGGPKSINSYLGQSKMYVYRAP